MSVTEDPKTNCVHSHWTSLSRFPVWTRSCLPLNMVLLIGLLKMAWGTGVTSSFGNNSTLGSMVWSSASCGTLSPLSPEEKDCWEIWLMSSCLTTALQNTNLVKNRYAL